jgi:hypothetical protein
MAAHSSKDILNRALETLETAKAGLRDVAVSPERRLSGLRNLVVFGRAVTNVLQNLRSTEPTFDNWYGPVAEKLAADPLMRFFYDLRTQILKRGETGVSSYLHIKQLQFPMDMAKFGPKPPQAKSFFIGDSLGGTGWEVETAPGVTEKYYVDLPQEIGAAGLYFRDAPRVDSRSDAKDADVVALSTAYIERLQVIVEEAKSRFG